MYEVISMSKAEIVIDDIGAIEQVVQIFTKQAFEKTTKLVEELRLQLESQAETKLIRRRYSVQIVLNEGVLDDIAGTDLFDVRLVAQ